MEDKKIFGLHRNVFFAGLVSLFMDVSSEMVYPLVPLFLTGVLGASKTSVGIIEGIAESTASLLKVFSGWLSDVLGKRKLLMTLGYGISTLSRPLLYAATGTGGVLTARFIDRFGKGVRTSPRDAIIAESTENHNLGRAFGFHRSMDTIGGVIGPALATILLILFLGNIRLVFLLSIIPAAIAVALIIFLIKEKKRSTEKRSRAIDFSLSANGGEFKRYLLVIGIFSLGATSDAFIILRAENVGIPNPLIPLLYLSFNVVYASTAAPLGRMADRVGLKKMLIIGFLLYSAIYAGFAATSNAAALIALFLTYGIFKGMSDGTQRAYLAKIAAPERTGTAFGLFHTVSGIMLLPASVIGGSLWDKIGPEATFLYGSLLSMLAAIIFILPSKKRPSSV
ncbi:MAG: MFS transporter [Thermodesulfobacteriota bacterium]